MKVPILTVCAMMIAVPALAQTETYESPGYTPTPTAGYTPAAPTVLDPTYGLPSFGTPEANLPQQRTLATEAAAAAAAVPADGGRPPVDFTPSKGPAATDGDTNGLLATETPVYTTTEAGSTGNDTMPDDKAE